MSSQTEQFQQATFFKVKQAELYSTRFCTMLTINCLDSVKMPYRKCRLQHWYQELSPLTIQRTLYKEFLGQSNKIYYCTLIHGFECKVERLKIEVALKFQIARARLLRDLPLGRTLSGQDPVLPKNRERTLIDLNLSLRSIDLVKIPIRGFMCKWEYK
jgi:hypothetical protein